MSMFPASTGALEVLGACATPTHSRRGNRVLVACIVRSVLPDWLATRAPLGLLSRLSASAAESARPCAAFPPRRGVGARPGGEDGRRTVAVGGRRGLGPGAGSRTGRCRQQARLGRAGPVLALLLGSPGDLDAWLACRGAVTGRCGAQLVLRRAPHRPCRPAHAPYHAGGVCPAGAPVPIDLLLAGGLLAN